MQTRETFSKGMFKNYEAGALVQQASREGTPSMHAAKYQIIKKVIEMSEKNTEVMVQFPYVSAVKDFVNAALRHRCTAKLQSDHSIVDARSIMGIFTLDLSEPVKLTLNASDNGSDDREDFLHEIRKYVVTA